MPGAKSYRFGHYRLESPGGLLYCANRLVPLAPKVAQTLLLLVEKAGDVLCLRREPFSSRRDDLRIQAEPLGSRRRLVVSGALLASSQKS